MRPWNTRVAVAAIAGLFLGVACSVAFNDALRYSCTSDADCGGDGFKCTAPAGGAGACCKPAGAEVCNGVDDDCNGLTDDGFPAESCNGLDDDCDQSLDEDFDLVHDTYNCGRCGNACPVTHYCFNGACVNRTETDCSDGVDNDMNGKTDCADPSCNLASCGVGCQCAGLGRYERLCTDGVDNDLDTRVDCVDTDCNGQSCGDDGGCTCSLGAKHEFNCMDRKDNDGDGDGGSLVDCKDSDCQGKYCLPADSGWVGRCASDYNCWCNNGQPVPETAAKCADGLDNDCDTRTDCADGDCNLASCQADGGFGCQCAAGAKKEMYCNDGLDNDGDAQSDCADSDCSQGTQCRLVDGGTGLCAADKTCR